MEVAKYMANFGASSATRTMLASSCFDDNGKAEQEHMVCPKIPVFNVGTN